MIMQCVILNSHFVLTDLKLKIRKRLHQIKTFTFTMRSRWKICQCTELGCNHETYQDETRNEDQKGKPWSAMSYKEHLKAIMKKRRSEEKKTDTHEAIEEIGDDQQVQ